MKSCAHAACRHHTSCARLPAGLCQHWGQTNCVNRRKSLKFYLAENLSIHWNDVSKYDRRLSGQIRTVGHIYPPATTKLHARMEITQMLTNTCTHAHSTHTWTERPACVLCGWPLPPATQQAPDGCLCTCQGRLACSACQPVRVNEYMSETAGCCVCAREGLLALHVSVRVNDEYTSENCSMSVYAPGKACLLCMSAYEGEQGVHE